MARRLGSRPHAVNRVKVMRTPKQTPLEKAVAAAADRLQVLSASHRRFGQTAAFFTAAKAVAVGRPVDYQQLALQFGHRADADAWRFLMAYGYVI